MTHRNVVLGEVRRIHDEMREHVGWLVQTGQHFTAVRLEAYADDLAALLEKERTRARRIVRESDPQ